MRGALVTLSVTLTLVVACRPTAMPTDGSATVTHVVDGDTIDVSIGGRHERVRLIGVDTPETVMVDRPVECFGPEATAYTTSLLPVGTVIRLERDTVGRDDYGRLLAYVHTTVGGDLFVNLELIRVGVARPMTIAPNDTFAAEFTAAARDAEARDLGLWAGCAS